jgi:hypothetical protein
MHKTGKKIDIDQIDLEREKDKMAEFPGLLPYAHTTGSALIKPEDRGKIKGRAVSAMYEQTNVHLKQLYDQMEVLVKQAQKIKDRVHISERIYKAKMGFEPLIGKTYYLYESKSGDDVLSLVGPKEWGKKIPFQRFLAEVYLLSDHTWDVRADDELHN